MWKINKHEHRIICYQGIFTGWACTGLETDNILVTMPTGNNDGQRVAHHLLHRRHWEHRGPDGEEADASNGVTGLYRNHTWCTWSQEAVQDDLSRLRVWGCTLLSLTAKRQRQEIMFLLLSVFMCLLLKYLLNCWMDLKKSLKKLIVRKHLQLVKFWSWLNSRWLPLTAEL